MDRDTSKSPNPTPKFTLSYSAPQPVGLRIHPDNRMYPMFVYIITNIISGMRYVGQTVRTLNKRLNQHVYESKSGQKCAYLHSAIAKYGAEAFVISLLDVASDQQELNAKESYWIKELNTLAPNGYNLRAGDNRSAVSQSTKEKLSKALTGKIVSEETKAKLSALTIEQMKDPAKREHLANLNRGKKMSSETKAKISAANSGKSLSAEHKANLSIAKTGKRHTEEAKNNMRLAHKKCGPRTLSEQGRKRISDACKTRDHSKSDHFLEQNGARWFQVFNLKGDFLGEFINITKCADQLFVNRSQVSDWLAGKHKSTRFVFKYIDKGLVI